MDRVRVAHHQRGGNADRRRALTRFLAQPNLAHAKALARPDIRYDTNFDFASSAALVLGAQALARAEPDLAFDAAALAVSIAPSEPLGFVLLALAAERIDATKEVRRALRHAFDLAPDEPAIALALGRALAQTSDLRGAELALTTYLELEPEDLGAGQLRQRLRLQQDLHRGMEVVSGAGISVAYPPEILETASAGELHQEISSALTEAARLTGLPRRKELAVVVYRDRTELLAATCVPGWTDGVFDGTLRLHAGSLADPQVRSRVVRHEVLHAQLRVAPQTIPHWFHEGVAQYFAGELGSAHLRSFRFMVKHGTHIPLESMDGSFIVIEDGDDAKLAYHQSLAMVQLLIAESGEGAIPEAIVAFSRGIDTAALFRDDNPGPTLLAHMRRQLERFP